MNRRPFHLAIPISDKESTRAFYAGVLNCAQGREAEEWIDFDFFGHQVSFHVRPEAFADGQPKGPTTQVDGKTVPAQHFGMVLAWDDWQALRARLEAANTQFVIAPYIRFEGQIGEQATLFFLDPSGNALEFKSFKDDSQIFAH